MLIIREEQIQTFIAADDKQLIERISQIIRDLNGARVKGYGDDKLAGMVKIGIERARTHELTKAQDIAAYVSVMFEVAPKFDEQAEIKLVLEDTNFPPEERFYQLFERVSEEGWLEAETLYENAFWFPAAQSKK